MMLWECNKQRNALGNSYPRTVSDCFRLSSSTPKYCVSHIGGINVTQLVRPCSASGTKLNVIKCVWWRNRFGFCVRGDETTVNITKIYVALANIVYLNMFEAFRVTCFWSLVFLVVAQVQTGARRFLATIAWFHAIARLEWDDDLSGVVLMIALKFDNNLRNVSQCSRLTTPNTLRQTLHTICFARKKNISLHGGSV